MVQSRATIVHYLGVMPAMLLSATPAESDTQHAVRWGFGAGVGAADHSVFEARFGFPLVEGWAMTETGAGAAIHASQGTRHIGTHYIGQPSSEVQVRVVAEDGSEAQAGETGELLVRASGPDPRRHFFNGYLKDEVATEEAWAGGWFHTGDVVRRDEPVATPRIWKGKSDQVRLGRAEGVVVSVPAGEGTKLKSEVVRPEPLVAPLLKGQQVGSLRVTTATGATVAEIPLTVLETVEESGVFGRAWDAIRLWIQ